MTKLRTYMGVAAVAAAAFLATPLTALANTKHCSEHQAPKVELACAKADLYANRGAVRWIKNHRSGQNRLLAFVSPHSIGYYHWRVRVDLRIVQQARVRLRPAGPIVPSGFPPHHALWMCIHSVEGPWNDTSSPYAGGLQMSIGWMKMVNNAGKLSQVQQEWIAERAYAANHYQVSFLVGQWFRWDGAYHCEAYAG